jgi:hypothetical protein
MARKKLSDELKAAILELPSKEKNKLLLRLITKDDLLTEQLHYQLLENTSTDLAYRITEIKETLVFPDARLSMKDIMAQWREKSSRITRFYKVTKDKKGELELLLALTQAAHKAYTHHRTTLREFHLRLKFKENGLKKVEKMNTLLQSLHEDYRMEYESDLEQITDAYKQL